MVTSQCYVDAEFRGKNGVEWARHKQHKELADWVEQNSDINTKKNKNNNNNVIGEFMNITGQDRELAVQFLEASKNNLEEAIANYFDVFS